MKPRIIPGHEEPILVPILSADLKRRIGWAVMSRDRVTIEQREYMRWLARRARTGRSARGTTTAPRAGTGQMSTSASWNRGLADLLRTALGPPDATHDVPDRALRVIASPVTALPSAPSTPSGARRTSTSKEVLPLAPTG